MTGFWTWLRPCCDGFAPCDHPPPLPPVVRPLPPVVRSFYDWPIFRSQVGRNLVASLVWLGLYGESRLRIDSIRRTHFRNMKLRLYNLCVCSMEPDESCVANFKWFFNRLCLHVITAEEYRVTAVSPAYNLLLSERQRRLRYLGHLLRLPHDSVVRRTLIAMAGGGNRYPEGSIFVDCQGSELIIILVLPPGVVSVKELKDLDTLAVNRTVWRNKVATLVF